MKPEQDIDSLQKIADSEFDRILDSPWRRFPPASVRDELIRRLKLRSDLSLNDKKLKYKRILERFRMVFDAESWVKAPIKACVVSGLSVHAKSSGISSSWPVRNSRKVASTGSSYSKSVQVFFMLAVHSEKASEVCGP